MAQALVTRGVNMTVVASLEVIDVYEQQRQWFIDLPKRGPA